MILKLPISYRQVVVFSSSLNNPYNEWTDEHFEQGFSFRPGSVSFDTLEDGVFEIKIIQKKQFRTKNSNEIIRIIRVPFNVNDTIEVGSINETKVVNLEKGDYTVYYCLFKNKKIELAFVNLKELPEIIEMKDKEKPKGKLILNANPA